MAEKWEQGPTASQSLALISILFKLTSGAYARLRLARRALSLKLEGMRILLPLHARPSHITKVLAKILGMPHTIKSFKAPDKIDINQPISDQNDWYLAFDREPEYKQLFPSEVGTCVHLCFRLPTGERQEWPMFTDTELENGKCLFPDDTNAVVNALGRRLIAFFGGAVGSNELTQIVPAHGALKSQWDAVEPNDALFPPIAPDCNEAERWVQFNQALADLPKLTADEVFMASQMAQISGTEDGSEALYAHLLKSEAQDRHDNMDASWPEAPHRVAKPRF